MVGRQGGPIQRRQQSTYNQDKEDWGHHGRDDISPSSYSPPNIPKAFLVADAKGDCHNAGEEHHDREKGGINAAVEVKEQLP